MTPARSRASASSTSPACCPAGSARCCSPTSAPTSSRSRTRAWATTSAGRRRTSRAPTRARRSALFLALNRNKRSIRIDLKSRRRAARCCCGSSRDADVVLESFRPGVLDRLGVGYERCARATRGIVYCAITGYGQDGPLARRAPGHDMNYLGLIGLLGLTGDADGPPVQAGRADRRPRRRRADGAPSGSSPRCASATAPARASSSTSRWPTARCRGWRWSPRAYFADGGVPRRGEQLLAARCSATGPTAAPTAGSRSARWSRSSGGWCRGVGREDLIEQAVRARRAATRTREVEAIFAARTRAEWEAFAARARLLPGARAGARGGAGVRARAARARWSSRSSSPARASRCGARHAGQARRARPGDATGARPGARRAHRGGAARGRLLGDEEIAALLGVRRGRPDAGGVGARGAFLRER